MGSATIRCCGKGWEVEFGWINRLFLIAGPYFVLGFVLNTFITAPDWWGNRNEALIVSVNLIFLIATIFALMEISREPISRWFIVVFVAEVGALVASVLFLIMSFEELTNPDNHEEDATTTAGFSTNEASKSEEPSPSMDMNRGLKNARHEYVRWEECIALIFLSLTLLMNSTFSRRIKVPKTQTMPDNCEETHDLQATNQA